METTLAAPPTTLSSGRIQQNKRNGNTVRQIQTVKGTPALRTHGYVMVLEERALHLNLRITRPIRGTGRPLCHLLSCCPPPTLGHNPNICTSHLHAFLSCLSTSINFNCPSELSRHFFSVVNTTDSLAETAEAASRTLYLFDCLLKL